jgi:hypothetical protein
MGDDRTFIDTKRQGFWQLFLSDTIAVNHCINRPIGLFVGAKEPLAADGNSATIHEFGVWLSLARALRSGRRGRWFKSSHPD